jgi:hypothetical protein
VLDDTLIQLPLVNSLPREEDFRIGKQTMPIERKREQIRSVNYHNKIIRHEQNSKTIMSELVLVQVSSDFVANKTDAYPSRNG